MASSEGSSWSASSEDSALQTHHKEIARSKLKPTLKQTQKHKAADVVVEDNPQPELDESEKGPNRLKMEQVMVDLKVVKAFSPTKLGGNWLQDILPEEPQRKLYAVVCRFGDRAFFVLSTKPLPRHNSTTGGGFVQTLRNWRSKKLGPDNITYVFTNNEGWVTKHEATQPVIDTMKDIMRHHPEPLSRVPFRWMQQLYTSCVLAALPDPYRNEALVLPKFNWALSRDAVQVNLDIPASNTSVAVKNEPWEYSRPLEIWITKEVSDDCAKLEIDPIFKIKESQEVQRKATAAPRGLAKFVAQKCAQNVMNQGEAMLLGQALVNQYRKKRENRHTGPFRGENMVVHCDNQNLGPSKLVKEACPDLPNIFVGSQTSQSDWKFHIAQAAHIRFAETGNVIEAWEAACETADLLLDFGRELLFLPCSESEQERAHTLHACYGCWFVWPCVKLTLIMNRRYCALCINAIEAIRTEYTFTQPSAKMAGSDPAEAFAGRSQQYDSIPQVTPHRQFTFAMIAAEWEHLKIPADIRNQERKQMESKFPKVTVASLGSGQNAILWKDAYSTKDLDPRRETSKSRAFIPSIEAVLPIFRADDGSSRIHIPTNMVPTAFYLNLLKGIFPPIVLKIIHMIYNTSQDDTETRRELMKRLDHIYLIRLQVPYKRKGRFTHSMTRQSFDDFKQQCQSGIVSERGSDRIPNGKLWNYKGFGKLRSAATLTDDSISSRLPQLKEVKEILLKLEHTTGQKLHRISGVPYPFQGGPEPKVWSWGILYQFLGLRLYVLRWRCNNRWRTDITVPVLIIVLCYQVLERQRKKSEMQWPECQEFLRLPISLYQMHPLSVSIGKADHSHGMVSGFKTGSKLSLENFDPAECNLLFETWSSNCAKSNFDADVDRIIKHFTETLRDGAIPYWPADLPPLPHDETIPQLQPGALSDRSPGDDLDNADDLVELGREDLDEVFDAIDPDEEQPRVAQSKQKDHPIKQGQQKSERKVQQKGLQKDLQKRQQKGQQKAKKQTTITQFSNVKQPLIVNKRRNMSNMGATCYLSSVVQELHNTPQIRDFVEDKTNFPLANSSKEKILVGSLRKLFQKLDQGGEQLGTIQTELVLEDLSDAGLDYDNTANDAAEVLSNFLNILISLSSTIQSNIGSGQSALSRLLKSWNSKPIPPLRQAAKACSQAYFQDGNQTELANMLLLQTAGERVCKNCQYIDRTWDHVPTAVFDHVTSRPDMSTSGMTFTLDSMLKEYVTQSDTEDMLERHANDTPSCDRCKTMHSMGRKARRIVKTPPILVLRWNRLTHSLDADGNPLYDQDGKMIQERQLYHVEIPEELDLAPWVKDVTLPSEQLPSDQDGNPMRWAIDEQTQYILSSAIHFRPTGAHYVSYVRYEGKWVLMDDKQRNPTFCTPNEGRNMYPDEVVCAAIYVKREAPQAEQPQEQQELSAKKHSRPLTSESTAELRGTRKGFAIVEEAAPSDGLLSIKENRDEAYDTLSGKKDAREERTALRERLSIERAEMKEKWDLLDSLRAELKEKWELVESLAKREQELTDFIEKS